MKVWQFDHPDVYIKEKKTGKRRRIYLSKGIRALAQERINKSGLSRNDYMFDRSRQQVWRVIKKAGKKSEIKTNIGTHTMRKTYSKGYIAKGYTVDELQQKLNHKNRNDTLGYLTTNKDLGLDEYGKPKRKKARSKK